MNCRRVGLILAFQIVDFFIDAVQMKKRPFRWIGIMAERNIGRVLIIHMTLIIGMAVGAYMDSARGLFLVFVILKTVNDLEQRRAAIRRRGSSQVALAVSWTRFQTSPARNRRLPVLERGQGGRARSRGKNEQPYQA